MQKVSVIIPCFNHAQFLPDSIRSVLQQTHQDLELIIIDDCSSDDSWNTMRGFAAQDSRVKSIRHEQNRGLSRSRNDGLGAASGEFIAFCDSDDVWEPEKLRIQLELLHKNPAYGLTYCDAVIINEAGVPIGQCFSERFPVPKPASGWLFEKLIRRNFINIQSVLVRKECTDVVGRFDEQVELVQDWWYWIQLSRHCRFLYSPNRLARYRVHSRSTNQVQKREYGINSVKVFERILRTYPDLPRYAKADVVFQMGAELCDLGKLRAGRHLLWVATGLSIMNFRAFGSCCRALRRLLIIRKNRRSSLSVKVEARKTNPAITLQGTDK